MFLTFSYELLQISFMQEDKYLEQKIVGSVLPDSESKEIQRFELLRNELIELERRVQRSADQSEYAEVPLTLHRSFACIMLIVLVIILSLVSFFLSIYCFLNNCNDIFINPMDSYANLISNH